MGAGSAVAAVAVRAGLGVAGPIWRRTTGAQQPRILAYALAGGISAATVGPWLALVLLACGAIELTLRGLARAGAGLNNRNPPRPGGRSKPQPNSTPAAWRRAEGRPSRLSYAVYTSSTARPRKDSS
jgi:hypothetical protein